VTEYTRYSNSTQQVVHGTPMMTLSKNLSPTSSHEEVTSREWFQVYMSKQTGMDAQKVFQRQYITGKLCT